MPTYAQLQAEAAWRQEVVTDELDWLLDALCAHFGVPRINGGSKGDNRHLNGGHRSQRWILSSRYCTNRTYSVEAGLAADLVDCVAAFDITLPTQHMLTISRNADRATRAGVLEELVEWFGNVDGDTKVDGWNNIANRVASSDSSHLWHLHGRIRRALLRDMATMRKIFAALTGATLAPAPTPTGDDDMSTIAKDGKGQLYHCVGGLSYPITIADARAIVWRFSQGEIQLSTGKGSEWEGLLLADNKTVAPGVVRLGWTPGAFGPVWKESAATVAPAVDLDALAEKVAAKLAASLGEAVAAELAARLQS